MPEKRRRSPVIRNMYNAVPKASLMRIVNVAKANADDADVGARSGVGIGVIGAEE